MIEKTIGYKVGDHYFPTIEEAQTEELLNIFSEAMAGDDKLVSKAYAEIVVNSSVAIMDILNQKPTRKYTKRAKGERKSRKAITEPPVE